MGKTSVELFKEGIESSGNVNLLVHPLHTFEHSEEKRTLEEHSSGKNLNSLACICV